LKNEPWIIEWSEKQKQFHTEPLEMRLKDNLDIHFFHKQKRSEWIVIGIMDGSEKASNFVQNCAKKRGLYWDENRMKWME
jgi:hypothetical protein